MVCFNLPKDTPLYPKALYNPNNYDSKAGEAIIESYEARQESYKIDLWRKEYVSTRWGNAVPSWEERKAETEEMLKQWLQKHFYWN